MSPSIITLTTDFGASDWYVGAMKGVVLGISPDVRLVDISHEIPPQDIAHAAFVLGSASLHFSPDTVHVAVVDPRVGTARRALLVVTPGGRFVAPDNGLLTHVLNDHGPVPESQEEFMAPETVPVPAGCSAYELTASEYWRHPVSDTFHGRDIFAPVAAHLTRSVRPEQLGGPVEELVRLNVGPPVGRDGAVEGRIIFIDHFGNIVSNIRASQLPGGDVEVELDGTLIGGLSRSFADGMGLLALVGSHGYVEIAERDGSAAERLGAAVGGRVRLVAAGSHARS